jgi:hypothetical protein
VVLRAGFVLAAVPRPSPSAANRAKIALFFEDGSSGSQAASEQRSRALIFDTILTELARLLIVVW